ncbi:uncharacterized protein LOC141703298 [Apium graveolens]|uniref:uncharacterized protein LOC141703298 n=1 Tax=Apium graveolens TaxID=4045 RepID=UPI003D79C569
MALQGNQDLSSVYYIHPSDANVTQFVSAKFNGVGFHNWKRSMILTLSTKNKLGFVDRTIAKPEITAAEFKYWERCNNQVISWLLVNLDESIAKSVLFYQTAEEIWQDLADRYGYTSMAQIYSFEQQLLEINQGTDSVSDFFTKIKTLWDGLNDANPLPYCTCELCTCNLSQRLVQRQQEHRVLQFMMKLSEQFALVRGNVLMMQLLPSIAQTYRLFAQDERHKEISAASTTLQLLFLIATTPLALKTSNLLVMVPNNLTVDRFNRSGVYGHINIGGVMQHTLPSSSSMQPTAPFSNPIQATYPDQAPPMVP